jgi:hypothetical protein
MPEDLDISLPDIKAALLKSGHSMQVVHGAAIPEGPGDFIA